MLCNKLVWYKNSSLEHYVLCYPLQCNAPRRWFDTHRENDLGFARNDSICINAVTVRPLQQPIEQYARIIKPDECMDFALSFFSLSLFVFFCCCCFCCFRCCCCSWDALLFTTIFCAQKWSFVFDFVEKKRKQKLKIKKKMEWNETKPTTTLYHSIQHKQEWKKLRWDTKQKQKNNRKKTACKGQRPNSYEKEKRKNLCESKAKNPVHLTLGNCTESRWKFLAIQLHHIKK